MKTGAYQGHTKAPIGLLHKTVPITKNGNESDLEPVTKPDLYEI
jgi:hypothetical protein